MLEDKLNEISLDVRNKWLEKKTKGNKELNRIIDSSLKQIYTKQFYQKIKKELNKNIKIREVNLLDAIAGRYDEKGLAWVVFGPGSSNTIYINTKKMKSLSNKQITEVILHEVVHLLQNQKKFLIFFQKFPEIHSFGEEVKEFIEENLREGVDIKEFLGYTRNAPLGNLNIEVIAYLIGFTKLRFSLLKTGAKKKLLLLFKKHNIYNIRSKYWKKRLKY